MPLSGDEMRKLFEQAGWKFVRQKGSHMRMQKGKNFETIPRHKELKKGTEKELLKRLEEKD